MTGPFAYDAGKWNININDDDELNPQPYLRRGLAKFVPTLPTTEQVTGCTQSCSL